MQYNFRLDTTSAKILYDINLTTKRSFSDIMRGLIGEGVLSSTAAGMRGNTDHIVGVTLNDGENDALRKLCTTYNVTHSECARRLLHGYLHKYTMPRTIVEAIEMLDIGRTDLVKRFIISQAEALPINDETPRDARLLLWIPRSKSWVIGRWDDDRYSVEPSPFWQHEGEPRAYCRNNPPSHYRLIPPPVDDNV